MDSFKNAKVTESRGLGLREFLKVWPAHSTDGTNRGSPAAEMRSQPGTQLACLQTPKSQQT